MSDRDLDEYVDRGQIAAEIAYSRKLSARFGWPIIDVTRRSVEETASMVIKLMQDRESGEAQSGEPSNG
jgi:[pyruvate, water dikinase]-phosphate phosphotransferase / [pyruvate, water dikinase] kinase